MQDGKAAAEQLCRQAEAEVKTLKENQALDFERIGVLSDENAALQVRNHLLFQSAVVFGAALSEICIHTAVTQFGRLQNLLQGYQKLTQRLTAFPLKEALVQSY